MTIEITKDEARLLSVALLNLKKIKNSEKYAPKIIILERKLWDTIEEIGHIHTQASLSH